MTDLDMTQENDQAKPQYTMPDSSPAFALAEAAAYFIHEKKGEEVLILDLRGRTDICDFFVITTGRVDVQVRAIADAIQDGLRELGQRPHHDEGTREGRWALLDYFNVIVHVMLAATRQYYELERLWNDAPRLEIEPTYFDDPAVAVRRAALADSGSAASAQIADEVDQG